MKITALELTPVRTHREMGRRAPSDPEPAESRHIVVQLHTDAGVTGLGEMSDVPWELDGASTARLQAALEPLLLGADAGRRGPLLEELSRHPWEHQVLCGIDMAVHDAVARELGVPLATLLGGAFRDRVPFAYPLAPCRGEADVAANLDRIEHRLGEGHSAFRYYFGIDLERDESLLDRARSRWGDGMKLTALDASGRFSPAEAVAALKRLAPFAPEVFESPVRGRHHAPAETSWRSRPRSTCRSPSTPPTRPRLCGWPGPAPWTSSTPDSGTPASSPAAAPSPWPASSD